MRKIPFALLLLCGLATSPAFAATTGTITINGEILARTCTIASGDQAKTITLTTVAPAALAADGAVAAKQIFTIDLIACTAADVVYARFSAETASLIDAATGTLKNQGTATHVNVALYEAGGTQINLADSAYVYANKVTAPATTARLMYAAGYYSTSATAVAPGTVKAVANYIIAYN